MIPSSWVLSDARPRHRRTSTAWREMRSRSADGLVVQALLDAQPDHLALAAGQPLEGASDGSDALLGEELVAGRAAEVALSGALVQALDRVLVPAVFRGGRWSRQALRAIWNSQPRRAAASRTVSMRRRTLRLTSW